MVDYLSEFVGYLKTSKSASQNTIDAYRRDMVQFIDYISTNGITNICNVTSNDILSYMESIQNKGKSESTVIRCVASIKCFYKYLISIGEAHQNPTVALKLPHEKKPLPEILTSQEVNQLLSQPSGNDFKGMRDKAMLELLYATGIRVSELVSLNISDIKLELGVLNCRSDNKSRVIPIYKDAIDAVANYIKYLTAEIPDENFDRPLFINHNGGRLSRQGFWKIIKNYAQQAGINKSITPHSYAKAFFCRAPARKRSRFEIDSRNAGTCGYIVYTYLHAANRQSIQKGLR